jgi:uncharacterized protein involved in exopolysaccharide biosynthesis
MNLKPELLATLTALGITEAELPVLYDRMMSLITDLQAQVTALSSQIESLETQKAEIEQKLIDGQVIAYKLLDSQTQQ